MNPINLDLAFSLKQYVDSRDIKIAHIDRHYSYTFEFFETGWIRKLIDKEYSKCIKTREDDLFGARMMISGVMHTMSSDSEEELKMKFIRFLLNY